MNDNLPPGVSQFDEHINPTDRPIVGFTGTRNMINRKAHLELTDRLRKLNPTEFHHGDCMGADAAGAATASSLNIEVHCHPPTKRNLRSFVKSDVTYEPQDYLVRNHAIVDACDILVACPDNVEEVRSGTWATVRYARKKGKPIVIIYPDATVVEENNG